MDENIAPSSLIYGTVATDHDGDTGYTLTGSDAGDLTIDPVTGQVTINGSPDYEAKSVYEFTVTVSDGALDDSIDVTPVDLNEFQVSAPVDIDPAAVAVSENSGTGTLVGLTVAASGRAGRTIRSRLA